MESHTTTNKKISQLGKYSLVRTLGKGTFAEVKLGYVESESKCYALKIPKININGP